jgi:hypothetical protein
MIALDTLKTNERNPRKISPSRLELLRTSNREFEKMLELRPIIIDEANICLGGNMRLAALRGLGYLEIPESWVRRAEDLTAEQKREFIIKDNVPFGEWNLDILEDDWDIDELESWGVEADWPSAIEPPNDFNEYDEAIDTEHECPKCGYQWSGKKA